MLTSGFQKRDKVYLGSCESTGEATEALGPAPAIQTLIMVIEEHVFLDHFDAFDKFYLLTFIHERQFFFTNSALTSCSISKYFALFC